MDWFSFISGKSLSNFRSVEMRATKILIRTSPEKKLIKSKMTEIREKEQIPPLKTVTQRRWKCLEV
jgi:hypothetical protein